MSDAAISSDDEPSPEDLVTAVDPIHSQPTVQQHTQQIPSSIASGLQSQGQVRQAARGHPALDTTKSRNLAPNRTAVGHAKTILPAEKVFPIQVGTELFRLSGASISSDGPSYFTQFFEDQIRQNEESGGVRTLYIDRDPLTFRDIARHLQGYYIKPTDGGHFVRLFADAQFYRLPRLITQLFESEIFIQIGEQHFQIPKDLFSDPGNSPNFFSLGFAVFFATPNDVFPGLDKRGLLRPPPINPPHVPSRSSEIFAQLLHLLRGYPLHIRDEAHRAELIRDCRYFHLRGLEQRIIAHEISYNLLRKRSEITLRLDDVKPSGISYQAESRESPSQSPSSKQGGGWIYYSRPFVDETPYEMIIEMSGESTELDLTDMRAEFHGVTKARVTSLLQVIANKMNLTSNVPLGLIMLNGGSPSPASSPGFSSLSDDRVKIRFDAASSVVLDSQPLDLDWQSFPSPLITRTVQTDADVEPFSADRMVENAMAIKTRPVQSLRKGGREATTIHTNNISVRSTAQPPLNTATNTNNLDPANQNSNGLPPQKKRKLDPQAPAQQQQMVGKWIIKTGQWRLRVLPSQDPARSGYEIHFVAVKLDAFSSERARNARRSFLTE